MAQRAPITERTTADADRERALAQFQEIQRELWEGSQDLTDDEREALVREVTEAVDGAIRQKVVAMRAAQNG